MMALCDQFDTYFADKIAQIHYGTDAGKDECPNDVSLAPACWIYTVTFQFMDPKDMEKEPWTEETYYLSWTHSCRRVYGARPPINFWVPSTWDTPTSPFPLTGRPA